VDVYVTIVASAELSEFTANQKAPILIWGGQGHQIINQAADTHLRAPLFAEVMGAGADADGNAS